MADDVPDVLAPVLGLLRRAYPVAPVGERFRAMLVVLNEHLSDRNLGAVVAAFAGTEAVVVQNEVAAALSVRKPSASAVTAERCHLARHDSAQVFSDPG